MHVVAIIRMQKRIPAVNFKCNYQNKSPVVDKRKKDIILWIHVFLYALEKKQQPLNKGKRSALHDLSFYGPIHVEYTGLKVQPRITKLIASALSVTSFRDLFFFESRICLKQQTRDSNLNSDLKGSISHNPHMRIQLTTT